MYSLRLPYALSGARQISLKPLNFMLFFGLHELSVNFNSRKLSLSFDHDLTVTIVTHSHRLSRAISRQSPVLVKGNQ